MRAKFSARRKELYLDKHPETGHGSAKAPSGKFFHTDTPSFSQDASKKLRVTDRQVRQEVRRGERIDGKVLDQVTGTEMDKGVELDALASMEPKQQKKAVEMVKAGKVTNIREARVFLNTGADVKSHVDVAEDDLKRLPASPKAGLRR
jgi:hypothetical protein